jgi:hypothetical protein
LSHHRKSPAKCSPQILFGWPKQFWEIIKNINPGFDHLRRDFDFILGRAGLSCFFELMYMRRAMMSFLGLALPLSAPAQKRPDRSNVALDMATIGEQHRFHTERDKGDPGRSVARHPERREPNRITTAKRTKGLLALYSTSNHPDCLPLIDGS